MNANTPADNKDKEEKKAPPASVGNRVFSPLEIFAYVLIGIATAASTLMSVSTQFYKNLFEHKVYPDIWEDRDKKYQKLYESGRGIKDLAVGTKKIEKDFVTRLDTELALTGIPAAKGPISYIKRTWRQFQALKGHERTEVVARLGLISSIGAAALWFIVGSGRKSRHNAQVKQQEARVENKSGEQRETAEKTYAGGEIKKTTQDGYVAAIDNARAVASSANREIL